MLTSIENLKIGWKRLCIPASEFTKSFSHTKLYQGNLLKWLEMASSYSITKIYWFALQWNLRRYPVCHWNMMKYVQWLMKYWTDTVGAGWVCSKLMRPIKVFTPHTLQQNGPRNLAIIERAKANSKHFSWRAHIRPSQGSAFSLEWLCMFACMIIITSSKLGCHVQNHWKGG